MKKLTLLRKKVDGNTKAVENLMNMLDETKVNAEGLLAQALTEQDEVEKEYLSVKAGYEELKVRCRKVFKFVSKILGE